MNKSEKCSNGGEMMMIAEPEATIILLNNNIDMNDLIFSLTP